MLAKVHSYGINGLDAYPIQIEVDVTRGLPKVTIVGLPDNAIKESKERVRAAVKNSGFDFPCARITVNLSPADIKKEGPSFDLAIALGILGATGQINTSLLEKYAFLGELSLDGELRSITGALCVSMSLSQSHFKGLILPFDNAYEAAITNHIRIFPVKHLKEIVHFLSDPNSIAPFNNPKKNVNNLSSNDIDFADVKGQAHVKRGLEIAASGGHNVLMMCSQYAQNRAGLALGWIHPAGWE